LTIALLILFSGVFSLHDPCCSSLVGRTYRWPHISGRGMHGQHSGRERRTHLCHLWTISISFQSEGL